LKTIEEKKLLAVWENGLNQPLISRSLSLLAAFYPSFDISQLASWPIGQRDARLLDIRVKLFGEVFHNTANCPHCEQKVEWEMQAKDLNFQGIEEEKTITNFDIEYQGQALSFRLPTSADIIEIQAYVGNEDPSDQLIRKCLLRSTLPLTTSEAIPAGLKSIVNQKIEEQDPLADIRFQLNCPVCKHNWSISFDIMQYLWIELNDWAIKLFQDIYLLASTFGWPESDILDMSRQRRNIYVNMIHA
jgi:hypothetical protein